jgi:hypothetical protein
MLRNAGRGLEGSDLILAMGRHQKKYRVTAQHHHICFVISLLMCKKVHIAGFFRASAVVLSSYVSVAMPVFGLYLSCYNIGGLA